MAARVRIPRSELDVHPLCLGGNVFGWTADAAASAAVLDAYLDAGGNFVDSADSYTWRVEGNSGGDSERVLGDWMAARGVRDRVVVATKVGSWPERPGLSPENVTAACDDSLRRLRTDHIDLYYAHRDDPDTPIEDALGAFDELVRAGKVRYVGLSNYSAERLTSALTVADKHGLARPVALQPHYNLVERALYEDELADVAADADLGVMPYFALAKGFLTGKYRPGDPAPDMSGPMASARAGGAVAYLDDRGTRVLGVLEQVADAHGVPMAAVALAWLAAQPTVTAPIASARTVEQLATILPMADLELAPDEVAALTEASEDTRLAS
ncbi:aryl-alcohol dehydrogenase (NADP+) [Actinomycetospora succinea]|uniref:Aryl-alcohol dehydrogenase (NADP+) n=1 Tax=Actinomycetospora succinea TaxID=663603 RepID=A0A4R6VDI6_9PSEU|nr:aldo/keto reductase [Actinomycetospora succinea]TDQ60863.1 aryl-alcohol dehydrogenase (NADP+) [Actinomycetospora succinea]